MGLTPIIEERMMKKKSLYHILGLSVLLLMVSCVQTPQKQTNSNQIPQSDSSTQNKVNSPSPLISGNPASSGLQGVRYSFVPETFTSGSIATGINLPDWASVNSSTGELSGYPGTAEVYNNIKILVTNGNNFTELGPFSLSVVGDDLFEYQWHILNTGQQNFADNGGTSGADLSLESAYRDGYTGAGVTVAVSDSGMDLTHTDLDDNLYNRHKNYFLSSPFNGSPQPATTRGDHGTSVAGIIAAEGWNSLGVRGIAPASTVAGFRYIGSAGDITRVLDQADGPYYIFNYSYGYSFTNYSFPWDGTYQDKLLDMFYVSGRSNLGALYVKSAGNSYRECDFYDSSYYLIENVGVCYAHNANMDSDNVTIPMIVVGALNANGYRSSYSSTGSSLWVSAFGGEYGSTDPAILTIDQAGCDRGYSKTGVSGTDFEQGLDALNEECDYTHTFNGTSSAAPMVSGIIALMLEANPALTGRDVKYILAATAEQVNDPNFDGTNPHENGDFFALSGHTYEQGWVTNAAGFSFHNHFGFGKVNGDAAVEMAKNYVSTLGTIQINNKDFDDNSLKASPNSAIPDGQAVGTSSFIYVNENYTIEHVQVMVNITHGRPGDIGIELTSPSGTKSILLNINNSLLIPDDSGGSPVWVADLTDLVLASNAFYGESSRGVWGLKVIDGLDGNTGTEFDDASSQTGTLVDWSINISGH
jgi:subtilisin family serine protease